MKHLVLLVLVVLIVAPAAVAAPPLLINTVVSGTASDESDGRVTLRLTQSLGRHGLCAVQGTETAKAQEAQLDWAYCEARMRFGGSHSIRFAAGKTPVPYGRLPELRSEADPFGTPDLYLVGGETSQGLEGVALGYHGDRVGVTVLAGSADTGPVDDRLHFRDVRGIQLWGFWGPFRIGGHIQERSLRTIEYRDPADVRIALGSIVYEGNRLTLRWEHQRLEFAFHAAALPPGFDGGSGETNHTYAQLGWRFSDRYTAWAQAQRGREYGELDISPVPVQDTRTTDYRAGVEIALGPVALIPHVILDSENDLSLGLRARWSLSRSVK